MAEERKNTVIFKMDDDKILVSAHEVEIVKFVTLLKEAQTELEKLAGQ